MERFKYKVAFWDTEVDVSKEMITYKNQNLPTALITGVAISTDRKNASTSHMSIGTIGGSILSKSFLGGLVETLSGKKLDLPADEVNLPSQSKLVIAYQNSPAEKRKAIRIPLNNRDQNCRRMVKKIKDLFSDKFMGVGNRFTTNKLLGISNKGFYIFITIIFLIIFGGAIFSLLTTSD